jgi:hypothetical protein
MKLSRRIFQLAFGCCHKPLSRVFTIDRRTYQVCLKCGKHVEYSWELMRSVGLEGTETADAQRMNSRPTSEVALV